MTTKPLVVLYDFVAETPTECSVRNGEYVTCDVNETSLDGWTKITTSNGTSGFVPTSFVKEVVVAPSMAPARPPPSKPQAVQTMGLGNNNNNNAGMMMMMMTQDPLPPRSPARKTSGVVLSAATASAAARKSPTAAAAAAATNKSYGAAQPGFLMPQAGTTTTRYSATTGGRGEVDSTPQVFGENLEKWRERERRFLKGEKEVLPKVTERQYFYWDRQGNRVGPLTEAQMRGKFDTRVLAQDTMISLAGAEPLPAKSVAEYFPNATSAFATAPVAPPNSQMWTYLDDAGQVQGPFTAAQMRAWFQDGYFNAETRAKLAERPDAPFAPLGVLFPEGIGAFLSEGNQAAAMPFAAAAPRPPVLYQPPPNDAFSYFDSPTMAPSAPPEPSPSVFHQRAASGRLLLGMAFDTSQLQQQQQQQSTNPFESPAYSTLPTTQGGGATAGDDWGITWDDEKDEQGGVLADEAAPVPESGPTKSKVAYAKYDMVLSRITSSHDELYKFLTRALPKDFGTIKCRIRRSMTGMLHIHSNVYELFLETDDGRVGKQLIVGNKYKRGLGMENYFALCIGEVSESHSGTVVAELLINTMGTTFLLHNAVTAHKGRPKELVAISYLSNISGGGPRKMQVVVPGFKPSSDTEFVEWLHGGSLKKSIMVNAQHNMNFQDLQPLINKPPVWSVKRGAWTLDFHGRVTRASVKNFQLVRPEDHDHVVLQHGRVGMDTFTMDMSWPLSPIQAFAIALSSLYAKLGVE